MSGGFRGWGKILMLLSWPLGSACAMAGSPEPSFSLLSGDIPGGMLLSAWSDGEDFLAVGGALGSGPGNIVHYDGSSLCYEQPAPAEHTLWWVHGRTPYEWLAVGVRGTIVDQDGARHDIPTESTLYGVYQDEEGTWVVGGDPFTPSSGEIWRKTTGDWEVIAEGLAGTLFKTWRGWFVGDGVAYFWDGTNLEERHPPGGERLITVHGTTPEDVWAVGGYSSPVVLHWTNGMWETIPMEGTCVQTALNGLWVEEGPVLHVAGHNGTMGQFVEGGWSCPSRPPTVDDFHTVVPYGDQMLWVGGNLVDPGSTYGILAALGEHAPLGSVEECL